MLLIHALVSEPIGNFPNIKGQRSPFYGMWTLFIYTWYYVTCFFNINWWREFPFFKKVTKNCNLLGAVLKHQLQDSPDQCPMPINADQNHGIDLKLIGIDRHWSALIGIDWHWDQCQNFDRHWSALGIDRGSPAIDEESSHSIKRWPLPFNKELLN